MPAPSLDAQNVSAVLMSSLATQGYTTTPILVVATSNTLLPLPLLPPPPPLA